MIAFPSTIRRREGVETLPDHNLEAAHSRQMALRICSKSHFTLASAIRRAEQRILWDVSASLRREDEGGGYLSRSGAWPRLRPCGTTSTTGPERRQVLPPSVIPVNRCTSPPSTSVSTYMCHDHTVAGVIIGRGTHSLDSCRSLHAEL